MAVAKPQKVVLQRNLSGGGMIDVGTLSAMQDAVVFIDAGRESASGVFVRVPQIKMDCLLTCEHVKAVGDTSSMVFKHVTGEKSFSVSLKSSELVYINRDLDFQIRALDEKSSVVIRAAGIAPITLRMSAMSPRVGDIVTVVQHPHGNKRVVSHEKISHFDDADPCVYYLANTAAGASGAAVLLDTGLIGLHTGYAPEKNANTGTKLSQIRRHINTKTYICRQAGCVGIWNYEGEYKNKVRHGEGKWSCETCHLLYAGDFRNGLPHGEGVRVDQKGEKYEGEFQMGMAHGFGVFEVMNEVNCIQRYKGNFEYDQPCGRGECHYIADQRVYVGEWLHGKHHGNGTLTFGDHGSYYEGEWKCGKFHGRGTFCWADGRKFVGTYQDGKRHGFGTTVDSDGVESVNTYEDDEIKATCEIL